MKLVKSWWKVLLFNIAWLGSLITLIGIVVPQMEKLGTGMLATLSIVLLLTVFGKQMAQLNRWLHKKMVGEEQLFFGKTKEQLDAEREQVKTQILGGKSDKTHNI